PYMKMNTLEKLRDCLLRLEPRIELPPELAARALVPLERMLALK
ncbi:MAG: quinolinate synthase NadA, partial [Acidobacteriia bacterium]|nr:quinolinate synthase NadA [Terriglobia bacterium]